MTDKYEALIAALHEDFEYHLDMANQFDMRPQDTVNWKHVTNCTDASLAIKNLVAERDALAAKVKQMEAQEPSAYTNTLDFDDEYLVVKSAKWVDQYKGKMIASDLTIPLFTAPSANPDAKRDETVQPFLENLAKDAERYRWLCECKYVPWGVFLSPKVLNEDGIDAAIDAAIGAKK